MAISLPSIADVKAIIDTDLADAVITGYINDAALMVEGCVSALGATRQAAIVKYVAAHLISIRKGKGGSGVVTMEKVGDAQKSYAVGPLGPSLQGSMYGQQALILDPNGCLAQIGLRAAKVRVL